MTTELAQKFAEYNEYGGFGLTFLIELGLIERLRGSDVPSSTKLVNEFDTG